MKRKSMATPKRDLARLRMMQDAATALCVLIVFCAVLALVGAGVS